MQGGVMFDTSAVLYLNAIYFIFYLLPLPFKFKEWYQQMLKWGFMIFNGIGLAFNHIDIIYYRFILKRTTASVFDIVSHDAGNYKLVFRFFYDFWYIALIWLITLCSQDSIPCLSHALHSTYGAGNMVSYRYPL
jgi:hypothetical protein